MARAFVTGGGGFLANHLAEHLMARGDEVTFLVRSAQESALPRGVRHVRADLLTGRGPLIPEKTDVIFHMAAKSSVQESTADPRPTFEVNTMGTARLLEEVRTRSLPIKRFVLASTGHVYGPPFAGKLKESHPLLPRNVYSASKAAAEHYALACAALYKMPVSIVRIFNVYGPGQKQSFVVASVLNQCLWSKDLKIGNPWPVRDFLYVSDAVRLFGLVATRRSAEGEVINAGTGTGTNIETMVKMAVAVTGAGLRARSEKTRSRSNDFDRLVADPAKARRLLGWQATVGLAEGLRRTADALRARGPP
jgi:nucleoside-diphosphate-sugar epimerase